MKRLIKCLLLLFVWLHSAAQIKAATTTNKIESLQLAGDLNPKVNNTQLNASFGNRIVVKVSGPSTEFEKPNAARIYINNVLMPYEVIYNCQCNDPSNTANKFFTLTFTLGPQDKTWNQWSDFGFGDNNLAVKLEVGTAEKVLTFSSMKNLNLEIYNSGVLVVASVIVGLFLILTIILVFCKKVNFIKDRSTADPKPFSLSRFQLLWWTVIIISCYILLFGIREDFGLLSKSTLILLGISAVGTGFSALVDYSDNDKGGQPAQEGKNFFYDILSDNNGINIHRYQNFIFTIIFGIIFVYKVFSTGNMPDFGVLELSLMGISTATYVGLKTNENNQTGASKTTDSSNQNIVG